MLTYRREKLSDIKEEVLPLLEKHWEEIALEKEIVKLDPDWDAYEFMDSHGLLVCVCARHSGVLIGYTVYFISRNIHYKELLCAENDLFFLDPEFRKGMAGVNLFRAAEVVLKGLGVNRISNKVKLHHDVGKIFERMGYQPIERVYVKKVEV